MRPVLATGVLCAILTFAIGSADCRAADNPASIAAPQSGIAPPHHQRSAAAPKAPKSGAGANQPRGQTPPPAAQGHPVKLGEVVVTATRLRQPLSQIGTSVSV